jgi:hypothetical protein
MESKGERERERWRRGRGGEGGGRSKRRVGCVVVLVASGGARTFYCQVCTGGSVVAALFLKVGQGQAFPLLFDSSNRCPPEPLTHHPRR